MLLAFVTIQPRPGDAAKLIDVLDSMCALLATDADCLGCHLMVEAGENPTVRYLERWRNREALDRHLRSSLYGRVLEAMELSAQPPGVEFLEVLNAGGLEVVEQARLHRLAR
ncbi:MAG: antibiotic biosynthesis monooxygenase [Salinivirgaceae bacterium]|nr:antibiotic biosynthesis monooxygenase [Salinivirgaceae bacterium]